ncbi:cupin domain-containing protein [Dermabacteraceae bacterium P13115]
METPINRPDTFGAPEVDPHGGALSLVDTGADAPAPRENLPGVKRLLKADGANLIVFTFSPGQELADHRAAHPIMVQCIEGVLDFGCDGQTYRLTAGSVLHLKDMVVHRVDCPQDAPERNVLQLFMLTGERH